MMSSPMFRQVRNIVLALLLLPPGTVSAASFTCAGVTAQDEKAICADRELSEKDVRMATTLDMLRKVVLMGGRGALQDEQAAWLQKRQACGDNTVYLSHLYDDRIDELNDQYQHIVASFNR
ncbi:lysozyme inhibitor LprI family protein [Enterobacter sp. Lyrl_3]|uniref:lysozyme inhibitor LprI family protein n=1 Tax=Enterobacter sp. Lyrl_3 TaxID=3110922 RepID=UPI003F821276